MAAHVTSNQRWSFPWILREWESGNGSFSFLRTLREWEWEWEWGIRKNFELERIFFFGIASESERWYASKNLDFFRCSSLSKMSIFFQENNHELRPHPFPPSLQWLLISVTVWVRVKVNRAHFHVTFNSEDSSNHDKRFIPTMSVVLAPEFHELSVHVQYYQFVNFVVTQQNISITHDLWVGWGVGRVVAQYPWNTQ